MPPPSSIPTPRLVARLLPALAAALATSAASAQQPLIRYAIPPSLVAATLAERAPTLTPDRIQLSSVISSTVADPTLHLLTADLRPDGNLSLRLACRTSAECLPFFAILSATDRAEALTLLGRLRNPAPAATPASATPVPASDIHAARVTVGTHVRLQLSDSQMHIQIEGIAIDSAEAGHEVRIASLDRRFTYRGIVVDATTVKGDLP